MSEDGTDRMAEVTGPLYGLEPGEFVAARNELARSLRKEGDRALAAEVAKLRRPSPAAWAVNQLARLHRSELQELVDLGAELRVAQDRALAGAPAGDLRLAGRARRDAMARLSGLADEILAERSAAHTAEVTATLEAASLDAEAAAEVLGGRLWAELRPPSGFGAFDLPDVERAEPPPDPGPEPEAEPPPDPGPALRRRREAEDAAAAARRQWDERSMQARDVVALVGESRQAVQEAEVEVARLEDLLAEAQRRLREAVREVEVAENRASQAEDAAASAAERLRDADVRLKELSTD